jgi:hypothetical protein
MSAKISRLKRTMAKVQVTAEKDFIESLTASRPIPALAELIWNGFDADSKNVQIFLNFNDMERIESIRVRDYGYGIDPSKVEKLFGSLGNSWKRAKVRQFGRSLHGKNGKGRFKAFALGEIAEWNTTYKDEGTNKRSSYKIKGSAKALDNFDISESSEANDSQSGTEVVIYNVLSDFRSLKDGSAPMELAKTFAAYLTEYPEVSIEYDGVKIDPEMVQSNKHEYLINRVKIANGKPVSVAVVVIEWNIQTERVIHLCDSKGVSLHEFSAGQHIRAPGFSFSVYLKSDHFRELDKVNELAIAELHPDVQAILKVAKRELKTHFRQRLAEKQSQIVQRWKEQHIYPYEERGNLNPVELAERQVFDILAANVQSYLPSFEDADAKSRRFTFMLLAQAIRQNPDSVQTIIGEVLGLKKEDQDDLADLLSKTPLSSIISSAKTVANRLNMLNGLEALLFDKESKQKLLERDQLHKILENEAWLFHEEFALAGSEQRLEEVLEKHIGELGKREEDAPVLMSDGKTGRVDLMLQKVIQPHSGEYDYLIVELKRPRQKINADVLTQIKKYAIAVASDQRFKDIPARWTFVAISNELDDFAKREANQRNKPKGQVFDDAELNITVWARPWADVINSARAKLDFINQQLSYEADRDSAKAYLNKAHAKFIPDLNANLAANDPEGDLNIEGGEQAGI